MLLHWPLGFHIYFSVMDQAIYAYTSGNLAIAKHLLGFARSAERAERGIDTDTLERVNRHMEVIADRFPVVVVEKAMAELGLRPSE
jgi:hypothetical protein